MTASLHKLMASDPWKEGYATKRLIEDLTSINTEIHRLMDHVKSCVTDKNYELFVNEVKDFKWQQKFDSEGNIEKKPIVRLPNIRGDGTAVVNLTD